MVHATALARVTDRVEQHYGLHVSTEDLPPPRTGAFDGLSIVLDRWNSPEAELFILPHLFGHTVQWCRGGRDVDVTPGAADPVKLTLAYMYEHEASRLGLALLEEAGVTDRGFWIARWFTGDWRYLAEFYRTGHLPERMRPAARVCKPLVPLPVPPFPRCKFEPRYAF